MGEEHMNRFALATAALAVLGVSSLASAGTALDADWTVFRIRNAADAAAYTVGPGPQAEILITEGGQKVGIGTGLLDGATIGDISHLAINRTDDYTRFATNN